MSISLLTNSSATVASSNLARSSQQLQQSLNRLSSGSKIVNPADDAGGLAVAMKLGAALSRQSATSSNVANAISYLQTQDGALATANSILDRISELKTLAADVTKNASDKGNYNTEFLGLKAQLIALSSEKFNGIDLFGATQREVATDADLSVGSSVALAAVDLLGSNAAPFATISDSFADMSNFANASAGTASASVVFGELWLETGNNDLARANSNETISGPWEMTLDFTKSTVANDMFRAFVGGSEVFSYDGLDGNPHSLRIVYDGADTAEIYLDGAGSPTETRSGLGVISGSLGFQLTSTVAGASIQIDNLSMASAVETNDVGNVAAASSLDALALGTVTGAIQEIASFRAQNGASQSRLGFANEQLVVNRANVEAARSRIMDVDVAVESTQLARYNILQQAGAAMLQQANQSPQVALRLLG